MKNTKVEKKDNVNSAILPKSAPEVQKKAPKKIEAVVYNGDYEVRRYGLENHGENFEELAKDFASKKGYVVKLEEAKQGIKCPSCGHIFSL